MEKQCNVIFGSGGVKTVGQLGTLKALIEQEWKIVNVCGVSAGSILATLYAYGIDIKELTNFGLNSNFYEYRSFNKLAFLNSGVFNLEKLGLEIFKKIKKNNLICNLSIGTCSILSGESKFFTNPDKKEIFKLVQASCAIPVLFKPIEYQNDYLIDGGVSQITPIFFYKETNLPTFVISCSSKPNQKDLSFLSSPVKVISRSFLCVQNHYEHNLIKQITPEDKIHFLHYDDPSINIWKLNPSRSARQKAINHYYDKTTALLKNI